MDEEVDASSTRSLVISIAQALTGGMPIRDKAWGVDHIPRTASFASLLSATTSGNLRAALPRPMRTQRAITGVW